MTTKTQKKSYKKARKRGTISRNKELMLKALIKYRNQNHKHKWPTVKEAFHTLVESPEHQVDKYNYSAYQPRLTNDLKEMKMVEEHSSRKCTLTKEQVLTWKPTQKGLQALAKLEEQYQ